MRNVNLCAALLLLLGSSFFGAPRLAAEKLADANQVLGQAEAEAKEQQKNILLVFGASWCQYCHQFEKFLAAADVQPIVAKHFVIARLSVYENLGRNPKSNNPNSEVLIRKFGNTEAGGLPFLVFVDGNGGMIANSLRPTRSGNGDNIGYPASREEIDWFMVIIKKAAPGLTDADSATVEAWLRKAGS